MYTKVLFPFHVKLYVIDCSYPNLSFDPKYLTDEVRWKKNSGTFIQSLLPAIAIEGSTGISTV